MTDSKHRGIEIDRHSALLGVDKGLARGKAQLGTKLCSTDLLTGNSIHISATSWHRIAIIGPSGLVATHRHRYEIEITTGLVLLGLHLQSGAESPILLALEGKCLTVIEHHLIDLAPLECGKHIILIGTHELIGWRHDIVGRREGKSALRELARQVLLLVERPDDIALVIPFLRTPSTGNITTQEQVGIEIGCGLGRDTGTDTIEEVLGDHGVDRANIHLARVLLGTCLDKVLDQCLQSEDDILEALDVLQVAYEITHRALALGKFYLTVLVPELIATHHRVNILNLLLRAFKQLSGQFIEGIIVDTRVTYHRQFLQEAGHLDLGKHIVDTEHPTAIGQLRELLHYLHILYPVYITLLRNGHLATLNLPTAIGKDIKVATETKVLLVIGQEVKVIAQILVDHQGVLDIITIEPYGIFADRRCKGMLQHTYLIIVDIHIGKHIFHNRIKDIARLEQVVDTLVIDALDDSLLIVRLLTIYLLRDGLINTDGQYELVVIRTGLNLVDKPLFLLILRRIEYLGLKVIKCQSDLLVLVVLIEVAIIQIGLLLGSNHLLHHLDRRIVLATISTALSLYGHFLKHLSVGLQGNLHRALDTRVDLHRVRHIAYRSKGKRPTVMARNGKVSIDI